MDNTRGNLLSMARVEVIDHPLFGEYITGPVPIIRGSRFFPMQEIRLEVSCTDTNGRLWKSRSSFLADGRGVFDTSQTPAIGETYYGVSREGPFTSMTCQLGPGYDFGTRNLERLTYTVACYDRETEIFSQKVTRYQGGDLHSTRPWVKVLLFGDEILSPESDAIAALTPYGIAASGHTLQECCAPAASQSSLGRRGLPTYIIGSGRASAKALQAAIHLPEIQGVVLFSGGGLRFGPPPDASEPATEPDYVVLDPSKLAAPREGFLRTRTLYADAVTDRQAIERGRIKVEHIPCPIHMFSGLDDQIWPASAFSEMICQRRKAKNSPFLTSHRTLEGVGHDLGPSLGLPSLPTSERTTSHSDTTSRLLLGGKMGRQARARRECWDGMLQILSGLAR